MGLKPICNYSGLWNFKYEHNYSLPIYFAFLVHDTYFWYAVTLVCIVQMCLVWIGDEDCTVDQLRIKVRRARVSLLGAHLKPLKRKAMSKIVCQKWINSSLFWSS